MTDNFIVLIAAIALAVFPGACSNAGENPVDTKAAQNTKQALSQNHLPQNHANILDIIEAANKAKQAGDAKSLTEAALRLSQIGAKPFDMNTPDLIKDWSETANALETQTRLPAYRGRVKGPAYRQNKLAPGAQIVLEEIFYASEKADLTLKTLSIGTLDLQVTEQSGGANKALEAVCTVHASNTPVTCQWLPLWTAKYNITISNTTQNQISYLLITN